MTVWPHIAILELHLLYGSKQSRYFLGLCHKQIFPVKYVYNKLFDTCFYSVYANKDMWPTFIHHNWFPTDYDTNRCIFSISTFSVKLKK